MVLSIVSVLLYLVSFPVSHLDWSPWPLALVALSPFFAALDRDDSLSRKFLAGAAWGAIMSLGLAYWLFYAMVWQYGTSVMTGVIFMIAGLMLPHGLLYGVFAVMYDFTKGTVLARSHPLLFYSAAVPSLWVITEFLREIIPLLVPWGFAGYALQPWNIFMQMADITGLYGISFVVVMINGIVMYLFRNIEFHDLQSLFKIALNRGRMKNVIYVNRAPLAMLALLLVIPLCYGAVRRHHVRKSVGTLTPVPVTIVQANFTQEERWSGDGFIDRVNICLGLAGRCAKHETSDEDLPGTARGRYGEAAGPGMPAVHEGGRKAIVVWPETILTSGGSVNRQLFSHIYARTEDARLIVAGGVRRDIARSGVYNTAYLVSDKDSVMFYDKNILLPYAETAPFGDFLGKYFTAPAEFLRGDTPPAARTGAGTTGLSICFEAMYGWHVRRSVGDGAQCLVNISNDGWFGRTSEPLLHVRQASVRSIENRRYLIRASNNGFSAIISPDGEAVVRSGLFTRECLSGEIGLLESKTPYTIFGDWIVYAAAVLLLGMLVIALVRD